MGELKIERHYPVAPERLFAFLTETANLLKWWGPEGTSVAEQSLDLTRTGPWNFVLIDPQGGHHRMSGEVRAVDAPHSVEFTLIVYEPVDNPSINSTVRFEVRPDGDGGSHFILTQTGLTDEMIVIGSTRGWTSTLARLERLF